MKTNCMYVVGLLLLLMVASCRDDEGPFASITGRWEGEKAELRIKADGFPLGIPYTVNDLATVMEFKADGTMVLTKDGKTSNGTYTINGKKLTINVDFRLQDIDLSGTYTIIELSNSRLKGEIEKEATVKNPETGSDVSGEIKATLTFDRI